jgi:hypothetical protein
VIYEKERRQNRLKRKGDVINEMKKELESDKVRG